MAHCDERFQDFRHVGGLGASELFSKIGRRDERGGGVQGRFHYLHAFRQRLQHGAQHNHAQCKWLEMKLATIARRQEGRLKVSSQAGKLLTAHC